MNSFANWKINSVAVAGVDKCAQKKENFTRRAQFMCLYLVYVSKETSALVCVYVCVWVYVCVRFLLTNDFSFRLRYFSVLFALFVLLCALQRQRTQRRLCCPFLTRLLAHFVRPETGAKLLTALVVDFAHFARFAQQRQHQQQHHKRRWQSEWQTKRRKLSKKRKDLFRFDQN